MGMTMTQKILARAAGLSQVQAGQLLEGKLDLVLGNDITTPVAIKEFEKAGLTTVFDRDKIAIVLDHSTPCKDIKSAQLCAICRDFAHKHQISHFYDVGQMGIEHALIPWGHSPLAWVPRIWLPVWLRGWPGLRCPRPFR